MHRTLSFFYCLIPLGNSCSDQRCNSLRENAELWEIKVRWSFERQTGAISHISLGNKVFISCYQLMTTGEKIFTSAYSYLMGSVCWNDISSKSVERGLLRFFHLHHTHPQQKEISSVSLSVDFWCPMIPNLLILRNLLWGYQLYN